MDASSGETSENRRNRPLSSAPNRASAVFQPDPMTEYGKSWYFPTSPPYANVNSPMAITNRLRGSCLHAMVRYCCKVVCIGSSFGAIEDYANGDTDASIFRTASVIPNCGAG